MEGPWHQSAELRETIGGAGEVLFGKTWACHCGSAFEQDYPGKSPGMPDFRCPGCGQLVDVKTEMKQRPGDNIAISQKPFDGYSPKTILAVYYSDGAWFGAYRGECENYTGPHEPAHSSRPTWYYWVDTTPFVPLNWYLMVLPLDSKQKED